MDAKRYPWERFWILRGRGGPLDDRGYFLDPETPDGRWLNPSARSTASLAERPFVVFLGEMGSGKSDTLLALAERRRTQVPPESVLFVDLAHLTLEDLGRKIFGAPAFEAWRLGAHTLEIFLDGLDECMAHEPRAAVRLEHEFCDHRDRWHRLRVRLACRTAKSPASLERLATAWPEVSDEEPIFEIAPLRRADVMLAAGREEVDATAFVAEVERRGLVPFATQPITLRMLLQEFRDHRGQLPGEPRALYRNYCRHLCTERNSFRVETRQAGRLHPVERIQVAERIAAYTVLGKRAAVNVLRSVDDADRGADLCVRTLTALDVPGASQAQRLCEEDVREVLGTALFSAGGADRLVWRHATYADFLAAEFVQAKLKPQQLHNLLFTADIGLDPSVPRVQPALEGLAAWLAAEEPGIFERLASTQPELLLHPALEAMNEAQRRALVDALMRRIELSEDALLPPRGTLHVLRGPGLAEALRPHVSIRWRTLLGLSDGSEHVVHLADRRWLAIRMVRDCEVRELLPELEGIALDKDEPELTRVQAALTLTQLGDAATRSILRRLLDDDDPDDELKGLALLALWPDRLMSAAELFERLTQPKRRDLFGAYASFLRYELVPHLRDEDLPLALDWVGRQGPDLFQDQHLHHPINEILRRAWSARASDAVLDAFARAAVARLAREDNIFSWQADRVVLAAEDEPSRRRLALALAQRGGSVRSLAYELCRGPSRMLHGDDMLWVIERAEGCTDAAEQTLWVQVLRLLFDPERTDHVEAAYESKARCAAVAQVMNDFYEVDLDSEHARRERARDERRRRTEREAQTWELTPSPERLAGALDRFEAGELAAWHFVTSALAVLPATGLPGNTSTCLHLFPAWRTLDRELKYRCLSAAEVYLDRGHPRTDEWLGNAVWMRPAHDGFRAVQLLLEVDPSRLDRLPPRCWERWAPTAFLLYRGSELPETDSEFRETDRRTVELLYARAPEAFIDALYRLIDADNAVQTSVRVARLNDRLHRRWDARLVGALRNRIQSDTELAPPVLLDLLELLADHDLAGAQAVAAELLDAQDPARARTAASFYLMSAGETAWRGLRPRFDADPALADAVLADTMRRYGRHYLLQLRSESVLGEIFAWLATRFPPAEDGASWGDEVSLREAVLNRLMNLETREAIDMLRGLAGQFPQDQYLSRRLLVATAARARRSWHGWPVEHILALERQRDARLVESGDQLLEVVLQSLGRLQAKLQDRSAVRRLWTGRKPNTPKDEADLSNEVAWHLQDDLRGVVVGREVQVRPGQETDVQVTAVRRGSDDSLDDRVTVIVEVKGCWNRDLKTAMEHQLVRRYLSGECRQGVYLVGWFLCDDWDDSDYRKHAKQFQSLDQARDYFQCQAAKLSVSGVTVLAVVLDSTWR